MENQNRNKLPTGLWIVSTPIGNLSDLSSRAREALGEADFILCEDTRRARIFLNAVGIQKSLSHLIRVDAHTERRVAVKIIELLKTEKKLALITDAGTPTLSDPGSYLIGMVRTQGFTVVPIPGASALLSLLAVSGFVCTGFGFLGFFPRKKSEINFQIQTLQQTSLYTVHVWYESPFRILKTMEYLSQCLPEAEVVVGKEMTKFHEKFWQGSTVEIVERIKWEIESEGTIGEWCFAIRNPEPKNKRVVRASSDWVHDGTQERDVLVQMEWKNVLRILLELKFKPSEISKKISQSFDVSRKTVYETVLEILEKK